MKILNTFLFFVAFVLFFSLISISALAGDVAYYYNFTVPTTPATYAPGQKIWFNISANDTVAGYTTLADNVTFETNITGSFVNYTKSTEPAILNNTDTIVQVMNFTINFTDIGANATIWYRWHIWNISGAAAYNVTPWFTYSISRNTSIGNYLNLYIDNATSDKVITYPTIAEGRGNVSVIGAGDLTFVLYRNTSTTSISVASDTNAASYIQLGNNTYYFVYNTTGGTNYTAGTSTFRTLIVQKGYLSTTLKINNIASDQTFPRGTDLYISAEVNVTNVTGPVTPTVTIYTNYTGALAQINQSTGVSTNITSTWNSVLKSGLPFGVYNIAANITGNANYTDNATLQSFNILINSSVVFYQVNLTILNSTRGANAPIGSGGADGTTGFFTQVTLTSQESGCMGNTSTWALGTGHVVSINVNQTCNYTMSMVMTDRVLGIGGTTITYNSTFVIKDIYMGQTNPMPTGVQLVPMGYYLGGSPSQKVILGGFAFNDTNIREIGGYTNATIQLARREFVPDGLYRCSDWRQGISNELSSGCVGTWTSVGIDSLIMNTTHLAITITSQPFMAYGFTEAQYNMRPQIKGYDWAGNISNFTVLNWGELRSKYFVWVPVMKFNTTSRQPYLATEDAYADPLYYDVPMFQNPNYIELLAYNFTTKLNFTSNTVANISITPRFKLGAIPGQLLSGNESQLMPAWSVPETQYFMGQAITRYVLRPTVEQIYYLYNGTVCGPYSITGPIGLATLYTSSILTGNASAFPCNYTVSYSIQTSEINLTLPNVSNPVLSVLFAMNGRPTTGQYSPIYLINQTLLGGFIPGPGQEPPKPGILTNIQFFVRTNNTLKNFTLEKSTPILHFLYPKNVTVYTTAGAVAVQVTVGQNFQLWRGNDTYTSYNPPTTTGIWNWTLIANSSHVWNSSVNVLNASVASINWAIADVSTLPVNSSETCTNMTDNLPGSPNLGQNITLCFQEFDFNLTSINNWLPGQAASNVTLNLTATLNISILNEARVGSGAAGETTTYSASMTMPQEGEVDITDKLPNVGSATSITVTVDGSATTQYRTGSVILTASSGTHSVSVSYSIPSAAAAAQEGGVTSTLIETGKVTKRFTSITPLTPRTITESEIIDANTHLTEIYISVKNTATSVSILIEKLPQKPADVTVEVTGKVYQYIKITKENLEDANLQNSYMKFKVNKTWINTNNIDKDKVYLSRWANGLWNRLNTTKLSEDSNFVYYKADVPGFSYFAIEGETVAVEEAVIPPPAPCVEDWVCTDWSECVEGLQTRTCTDRNACGTVVDKPAESQACVVPAPPAFPWTTVLGAIILIAAALFALLKFGFLKKRR